METNGIRTQESSRLPLVFFKLLIIHGYYKQNMCPSVFLLMSRLLFESYKFVIEKLILAALNLEIQLNPKAIF